MKTLFRTFRNIRSLARIDGPDERYVAYQLMQSFTNGEYAVLNNILLPAKGRIGTTQIDHLVVSIHGVFCIETKSHKGWIFGSKVSKVFTQVLYRSKYRITPNPVEQNEGHIKALNALLQDKLKAPIVNIVVFPSASKFVIDGYENVGTVNDLIDVINSYSQQIYRYDEAIRIIETLGENNQKNRKAHLGHIRKVSAVYAHHY